MKTFTTKEIELATAYVMAHHEPTAELLANEPIMLLAYATFVSMIIKCLESGEYND